MTLIPHKRAFLGQLLCQVGVLRLLEALACQPRLLVLTYHRIVDPGKTSYYGPVCSATPEAFAEQLQAVSRRFKVVGLDQVDALARNGYRITEPTALITFDDGYRDNFEVANPILKTLGLPATFFLPTAFHQRPRLFWWDHIALVLNTTSARRLVLDWPEAVNLDLEPKWRANAIAELIQIHRRHHLTGPLEARFLDHLDDRAEVEIDAEALGSELFMTTNQVRTMLDAGMSIGSHSHSHVELARLGEIDQRDEMVRSKAILEQSFGQEIKAIAYPYGWPGACDANTERYAQEAGYTLGFGSSEGLNLPRQVSPFAIKRFSIGSADSPTLLRARLAIQAHFGRSWL